MAGQERGREYPQGDAGQTEGAELLNGDKATGRLPAHSTVLAVVVSLSAMVALCVRNSWVFSLPIREDGDFAANSILVNQAVRFQLLVGNYSREEFNHPGRPFCISSPSVRTCFTHYFTLFRRRTTDN
jgi:hypothetical protein